MPLSMLLVIGSQLLCWVIILSTMFTSTHDLYKAAVLVILPMNSYLNPIFNSFLFTIIRGKVKQVLVMLRVLDAENDHGIAEGINKFIKGISEALEQQPRNVFLRPNSLYQRQITTESVTCQVQEEIEMMDLT